MSFVNSNSLLQNAMDNGYAVPAFNANCLEIIPALIRAAEKERAPLILQISKRFLTFFTAEEIASLSKFLAEKTDIPVCLHLDHGNTYELASQCLNSGFTSVMYDGSLLPFEENIKNTLQVVSAAHLHNAHAEGELGKVLFSEQTEKSFEEDLTDPDEAQEFVKRTGIDSLAVSVGNIHRMLRKTADIQFELIKILRKKINVPLVIHGSSGISDDDIRKAVSCGISKVNVATEFGVTFIKAVKEYLTVHPEEVFPMEIQKPGMDAVTNLARNRIRVLDANNRY